MRIAIFLSLLVFATPSFAEYQSRSLFSYKAWEVALTHNSSNGTLWCDAKTKNRAQQTFSITAYDDNSLALFVFDHRWNLIERPVRFLIDVDYSRWTIDGRADNIGVSLSMDQPKKSVKFLTELARGSAVAILNQDERRLAIFSLAGSSAALNALVECSNSITKTDPFFSEKNPF